MWLRLGSHEQHPRWLQLPVEWVEDEAQFLKRDHPKQSCIPGFAEHNRRMRLPLQQSDVTLRDLTLDRSAIG